MKYRQSGLLILFLAFFALLFGISFVTGQNAHHGPGFSALGVALVFGSITVLTITVRRWAGYFCAVCALGAVKAVLAMTVGYHTLSGTLEMIGPQILVMLVTLAALSYRFTVRLPRVKTGIICTRFGCRCCGDPNVDRCQLLASKIRHHLIRDILACRSFDESKSFRSTSSCIPV